MNVPRNGEENERARHLFLTFQKSQTFRNANEMSVGRNPNPSVINYSVASVHTAILRVQRRFRDLLMSQKGVEGRNVGKVRAANVK